MTSDFDQSIDRAERDLSAAFDRAKIADSPAEVRGQLGAIRQTYLAKRGVINQFMRALPTIDSAVRPSVGQRINDLKASAEERLAKMSAQLEGAEGDQRLQRERLDVTLPGFAPRLGTPHPVRAMIEKAMEILRELGFSDQQAPEIDDEHYMFDALNFPRDHPAREMQDTFYITDSQLLRSHATNAQARWLERFGAPLRAATAGKVFRNEEVSARTLVAFHQIDVLVVDRGISYGDLIDHLNLFFTRLMGDPCELRIRLSYFPFVQPGIEVDIRCPLCGCRGCAVCKHSSWIEVCGAGMVHPKVLKSGGVDSEQFTGFAWGMGIERLAMLQYGIRDIRQLALNDVRFLQNFQTL